MTQEQLSTIWPDWVLIQKLGQGSYGGVYEIQRVLPGGRIEKAALKQITIPHNQEEIDALLVQSVSQQSITEFYREQMQKLVQEYSMMHNLGECPNIVSCQDLSYQPNGYGWDIYFRMELLHPLKQVIDNQYREMNVIRLGLEVCNALEACEALNIIHRDIKPENILVSEKGVFKLGDFGIAKTSGGTQTGTMAGTFGYMAPEVANRKRYGSSADIYSLGLVLYWLMNCKTLPFLPMPPQIPTASQRQQALNRRFSGEQIPEPRNGSVDLKKIVMKACAFTPADRYHSAIELKNDLRKLYHWKQEQTEVILEEFGLPASIMEESEMPELKKRPGSNNPAAISNNSQKREKRSRMSLAKIFIGSTAVPVVVAACAFLLLRGSREPTSIPQISVPNSETSQSVEPTQTIDTIQLLEPETTASVIETTEVITVPVFTEATEPVQEVNVEYTYERNETGITVTGYAGDLPTEAVLPNALDGVPVTKIGNNAFSFNSKLKKIWIPDGVTEIGERAFSGCTKLQNVDFPSSLIRIGASAFENCSSLGGITLPEGIQTIDPWAFVNCKRLTELEIPSTTVTLGEWSFSGCTSLSSVRINVGITSIENYVFFNCQRLTEIVIPDGVKIIGIGAFSGCTQLSSVALPNSLITLSAEAFQGTALKSITVSSNCSLGDGAIPLGCSVYHP